MRFIQAESKSASAELAKKRGNFPAYAGSVYDSDRTPHMRNATTTTIAPTGTLSIIAGTSSGIEPLFAVSFSRKVLDGNELREVHPQFLEAAKKQDFFSDSLMELVTLHGGIQQIDGIPDEVKGIFLTAHDVPYDTHVKIQGAFQEHTDNAVSKTINFHGEATVEDVKAAYLHAFHSGCKGITIYRYGSRTEQVLNLSAKSEQPPASKSAAGDMHPVIAPRPRPARTTGFTERIGTGCGKLYVTINSDEGGFCEVFAQMGKTGGCAASQIEMAGRLISLALRSGVDVRSVVRQLRGIRCPSPAWHNGRMVLSCSDAVAQVINEAIGEPIVTKEQTMGACPDCGGVVEHEGGCLVCRSCGFSRCD